MVNNLDDFLRWEEISDDNIKVKRIGLPDKFIEHGSQSIIRDKYRLTPPAIASTISEFLSKHGFQKQLKFINNAKKAVG